MGAILNEYNRKQVAFWIDGYFHVIPGDRERNTVEKAFEYSRKRCVEGMLRHIDELNAMSLEKWQELTECNAGKPGGIPAQLQKMKEILEHGDN